MALPKMGLTHQQYMNLCAEAKELHDYWRKWNPNLYMEATKDGSLYNLVATKGQEMQDEIDELMQQGMYLNEAREIVRAEIYSSYQP